MRLNRTILSFLFCFLCTGAFAQAPVSDSTQKRTDTTAPVNPVTDSTGKVTGSGATPAGSSVSAQVAPAKGGTVSGILVDNQNKPLAYATVTLLRADSTVVNGDLTKDDGSFSISPTGTGTFILSISAIGLKSRFIPGITIGPGAMKKDLGNVKATSSTNRLKEVDIVAEKPIMQMDVDKKVFNVEKNTTTAGGSASDVLSNVPAVSVDVDGNVSLRNNSNVTILIDGKPATLLGSDQASALQSLPASSIESVEVITNPSAKYDAQGPTGIINIVTKKDGRLGVNGSATLGIGTGDKYNGAFSINVRKGKWNVFLNSNFRLNSNYNNTNTDTRYDNGYHTYSYEHGQRQFDGSFNTIGASYDFDKNNTITLTQSVNIMGFGNNSNSNAQTTAAGLSLDSSQERYSNGKGGPLSLSTSADYKRKFKKKGEELDIDATFANTNIFRTQTYSSFYTNNQIPNFNTYETAPGQGNNKTFTAYVDYADPLFTKNGKLGFGAKTQLYKFQSNNSPLIDTNGGPQLVDYTLAAHFNYNQQIHAGYVNWNDQLGKFSYQVGLRGEYSQYDGTDVITSPIHYSQNYPLSLFPSAFVSYQLPDQQSIYLNYSRRTNRPNFFQLLPYKDVSNPSVVSQGNPDLKPEFIHNVEFSYSKATKRGDNFIISAYYTYTQNLSQRISRIITGSPEDDSLGLQQFTNKQYSTTLNVASGTTYGAEATGHVSILPFWDATLDFNFFQNQINVGNIDTAFSRYVKNQSAFSWFGKINTNFKLPGGFSLQLNGNYESPKVQAQGTLKEVYWIDVALRKNLWKNKVTIVANCSDIFNTRKYTTTTNIAGLYNETYYRDRETRVGNLTFTYRFGSKNPQAAAAPGGKRGKKGADANKPTIPDNERENNLKGGDDDNGGQGGGQGGGGGPKSIR
ncbi:MAG: TonB-dependent receptor [Flavipsychrobacter sp.]|nr:TonB-dependent receptor [Flavipsychrobacter sp.]